MGRSGATVACVVALAGLVLGACGSIDPEVATTTRAPGAAHPVAVADEAVHPSGTALGPGVQVQEGSSLIGPVFPTFDREAPGPASAVTGWEAVLVVDGDPIDVWNRYTSALGVDEIASARKACTVGRATAQPPAAGQAWEQRFLTEPVLAGEDRLACSAVTDDTTMQMVVGATCGPTATDPTACDRRATAHLHLSARQTPTAVSPGVEPSVGTDALRANRAAQAGRGDGSAGEPIPIPEGDVVDPVLDLTDLRSVLPKAGESLDGGLDPWLRDGGGDHPIALLRSGARSLVAPALVFACAGGLVAVVEIPGSPAEVVAGFDEADDFDDPTTMHTGTDALGQAWAGGRMVSTGGYGVSITAVPAQDGRSTALVTQCRS